MYYCIWVLCTSSCRLSIVVLLMVVPQCRPSHTYYSVSNVHIDYVPGTWCTSATAVPGMKELTTYQVPYVALTGIRHKELLEPRPTPVLLWPQLGKVLPPPNRPSRLAIGSTRSKVGNAANRKIKAIWSFLFFFVPFFFYDGFGRFRTINEISWLLYFFPGGPSQLKKQANNRGWCH